MKLFLDDYRTPEDVTWADLPKGLWQVVRNYKEFVEWVDENGVPAFVAYDHDLDYAHYGIEMTEEIEIDDGEMVKRFELTGSPTGFECAKYLKEFCKQGNKDHPPFIVHSMNEWGKKRIEDLLNSC